MQTTINQTEIENFSKLADTWWNVDGPFKPLHMFNPIRLQYLDIVFKNHFGDGYDKSKLSILDIGCGGGLLSEPLARQGFASITGIDASKKNIAIASAHAKRDASLAGTLKYQHSAIEDHNEQYDIILNMEVIEHVDNVPLFLENSLRCLKDDGIMVIATLNRTIKSYGLAIIGAEYILRWLPVGTHSWKKFLKPSEISSMVTTLDGQINNVQGFTFNPIKSLWKMTADVAVNYALEVTKKTNHDQN
jgi:2-polyprenyl-6-hydroxyphenyl methylase/3-demethylubiquinone-9 3-methyltransferase